MMKVGSPFQNGARRMEDSIENLKIGAIHFGDEFLVSISQVCREGKNVVGMRNGQQIVPMMWEIAIADDF